MKEQGNGLGICSVSRSGSETGSGVAAVGIGFGSCGGSGGGDDKRGRAADRQDRPLIGSSRSLSKTTLPLQTGM